MKYNLRLGLAIYPEDFKWICWLNGRFYKSWVILHWHDLQFKCLRKEFGQPRAEESVHDNAVKLNVNMMSVLVGNTH